MLDLTQIDGFEWDQGNSRKSLGRHGVEDAEAEQLFIDVRLLVVPDEKHSAVEARFHALGATLVGRRLFLRFTLRRQGKKVRVISARDMNRKERARYDEEA